MTRKDYVAVAGAICNARAGVSRLNESAVDYTAQCVADTLAADNPRFDREKFLIACGVQP